MQVEWIQFPGIALQPHRLQEETCKEDRKITELFSEKQFKYPVGIILSISEGGSLFGGFSEVQQGLEGNGWGILEWSVHLNILDSLDIWMPKAGLKLPPEQYGTMGKKVKDIRTLPCGSYIRVTGPYSKTKKF